jgi:anthranilate synthase/aminodeoxychorismate synthase-like glutamine amidotransferase
MSDKIGKASCIIQSIETFKSQNPIYDDVTIIDAKDSFTHNLVAAFLKLGANVAVLRAKYINETDVERNIGKYLVFAPGPGVPSEAGLYEALITKYYRKVPILGVCLGMQAITEVFGGRISPAPQPMHGKISTICHDNSGIFQGCKNPTKVARYHSLACYNLPLMFKAQAEIEGVLMAFHEPNWIAAVQFHPESFLTEDGSIMLKNFLKKVI